MLYFKLEAWDRSEIDYAVSPGGLLLWSGSRHRATSSLGAIRTRHTPKSAACRCLQALCMRRSGSYIIQAWRLFNIRIKKSSAVLVEHIVRAGNLRQFFHSSLSRRLPLVSRRIRARALCTDNCFIHAHGHYPKNAASAVFRPDRFFIWLAENLGTLFGVWRYPNQIGAWASATSANGVRGLCW